MPTFLLFFILAVVIWAMVSLVLLYLWQDKKEAGAPQQQRDKQRGREPHQAQSGQRPFARANRSQREAPTAGQEQAAAGLGSQATDWQQQLSQIPGVLGWLLIDTYGEVLLASDLGLVEAAANDPTIRKIVAMISRLNPEVGDNSLRLMEWEGPQGQVLVAFPEDVHTPERLVLFLDTETYKHQMRDLLTQLHWESQAQREPVKATR